MKDRIRVYGGEGGAEERIDLFGVSDVRVGIGRGCSMDFARGESMMPKQ